IGNDVVISRQLVVVDAVDDGEIRALSRGRNQNTLGAGAQVGSRLVALGEDARAFEGDIDAEFSVLKLPVIADGPDLDRPGADVDGIAVDLYFAWKAAVYGIEAQQMSIGFNWSEIVNRYNLNVLTPALSDGAQDVAPDAAKTVDGDSDSHFRF